MKKFLLYLFSLSFILVGCQSNDNNGLPDGNIAKVSISKSSDFGKVNADFLQYLKFKKRSIYSKIPNSAGKDRKRC
ncbi:hypothetical protein ACIQ2D_15670 [Lysinibacillus sp. NPDC097287]|uniref:hypothetical protein n=1 Tax=Lysinibacillus sp. NPDC097287 TaxID=3364144 RepID=UPI0037F8402F